MGTGNIKGIVIEIGGDTTKLGKALDGVNKKSKDIQGELKQVERLLKLDPTNTALLEQRQKLLADAVGNTKGKLETLKEAEKQVQKQFEQGKVGEEQYRLIQREVIATEQNLKSLETRLAETNRNWKEMGKNLQDAGSKMKDVGGKMTVGVTAPIAAAGAASFKFAADLQDSMGASDQIFKDASGSIKVWADGLESYYGIAEGEAITYANTMGAMLQNIGGLSADEASKQSQTLVELAGDLTAMFGGTTESAIQALTGALKGNNSMLDNYGMGVNEATIKSKALEMGLIAEGEQLDLAGKQAATLALIMEQTSAAQGQAGRESDGASGSMRGLTTELKNVATELGEVLLPIITPFVTKLKEIVERFGQLSPEMQKVILIIAGIAAAIGPLLMIVGSAISLFGSLSLVAGGLGISLGALLLPIGIVIAAIAAIIAIGVLLYKNWDTISAKATEVFGYVQSFIGSAIENIKGFFSGVIDFIQNNWQGLLLLIVNPFAGAFLLLYNNLDGFRSKVDSVFESVKSTISNAIQAIKGFFNFNWSLPHIKLPHFSIEGEFGLNPPRTPYFDVNWYDKGGIFNSPSIIGVGEKRPEFVGALDDLRKIVREEFNHSGNQSPAQDISLTMPVYLDGKEITRSTSRIQVQNNLGKARALGVNPT